MCEERERGRVCVCEDSSAPLHGAFGHDPTCQALRHDGVPQIRVERMEACARLSGHHSVDRLSEHFVDHLSGHFVDHLSGHCCDRLSDHQHEPAPTTREGMGKMDG